MQNFLRAQNPIHPFVLWYVLKLLLTVKSSLPLTLTHQYHLQAVPSLQLLSSQRLVPLLEACNIEARLTLTGLLKSLRCMASRKMHCVTEFKSKTLQNVDSFDRMMKALKISCLWINSTGSVPQFERNLGAAK